MPSIELAPRLIIHYLDFRPKESPQPSREPVLLLHGLGATGDSWGLQIPCLVEAGFRVIAPDTRGFGHSSYPGGKSSISRMAADIDLLLSRLDIRLVNVVGISMGGTIALQFALDHPSMVKKLALVSTFASLRPDRIDVWLYFAFRFILVHTIGLPAQARAVAKRIFPGSDQLEMRQLLIDQICLANPSGYRAAMRSLAQYNATDRLGGLQVPTLVITGDQDSTVPPKNQRFLVDHIRGAQQCVIPKAGHAVIAEKPQEFNRAMLDFLCSPS